MVKEFDWSMLELDVPPQERQVKLVTDAGEVQRLNTYQKNTLYAKAQMLKEQIRQFLLSKTQLQQATDENVDLHLKTESTPEHNNRVREFRDIMKVIGADPNDISIERMRKG